MENTATEGNHDAPIFKFRVLATESANEAEVKSISDRLRQYQTAYWGDLLCAAPRTLCSIGQCFVIAWSERGDIEQNGDKDISTNLRTNLVNLSDLGREAFRETESKVHRTSKTIESITGINGAIHEILSCLGEENPTSSDLSDQLDEFKELASECVEITESVTKKFKVWQDLVWKIYNAYGAASDESANERLHNAKAHGPPNTVWKRVISSVCAIILFLSKRTPPPHPTAPQQCDRIAKEQWDAQRRLDDMENRLRNMASKEKASNDVATVLYDCWNNLSELLTDIAQLVDFFTLLKDIITLLQERLRSGNPGEFHKLSKVQIADLQGDILKLRVHYTIAGDISYTYAEVSRKYIMPGINKVESLSKTRTQVNAIDEMCQQIADYSKQAQAEIQSLVEKRRQKLNQNLYDTARIFDEVV